MSDVKMLGDYGCYIDESNVIIISGWGQSPYRYR